MYGGKKRKITNTISANKQNPQQEMDDLPLFLLVLLALIFFRFHVVVVVAITFLLYNRTSVKRNKSFSALHNFLFLFFLRLIDWSSAIADSVRTFFVVVFFPLYIIFFYVIS